ncbi:hypothetical protein HLH17_16375 [Acinetobacter sp. ANC 5380]|uniref:Conjugal transfer protein TraH n=1 Tax=Acinetobacter terrae TaxID=2731247 RepID=A0A7Y2RIL6_9GAMM|nr:conjugal transfer protein TraH [Acinetobacter terrae]NNH79194.1 hypothetical protein [Acinetobacter terrae]
MKIKNKLNGLKKFPKLMIKPLQLSCFALTVFGTTSQAGSLDNFMGDMYSNTTAAGMFSTQQRGIISGGSFVGRFGIKSINLVHFDPPRVSGGCAGINLFGGSFSFINAEQLTQVLRAVAQNALGLLFQLGLNAISQPLSSMLSTWAAKLQEMNSLLKNSCEAARKLFQLDTSGSSMVNSVKDSIKGIKTSTGAFKDYFGSVQKEFSNGWNALRGKTENQTSADRAIAEIPNVGNVTWRAINATDSFKAILPVNGGNELEAKLMLMNFIGTEVFNATTETKSTTKDCASGGSQCDPKPARFQTTLTIADLISPKDNIPFYTCQADDTGDEGCAQLPLQQSKLSNQFRGVAYLVNKNLYGIESSEMNLTRDQIVAALNQGKGIVGKAGKTGIETALTTEEKAFQGMSNTQLIYYISKVNNQLDQVVLISEFMRPLIIQELAVKLATALQEAATLTFNGSNIKATPPDNYQSTLAQWKQEIYHYDKVDKVQKFNEANMMVDKVASTLSVVNLPVNAR